MTQTGYIEKVLNDTVQIRIKRNSACGDNCGNCSGCKNMTTVYAKNEVNAQKGDFVEIEMPANFVLGAAFITYIIPLIILIIGYLTGYVISKKETAAILTALIFFIISMACIVLYSHIQKDRFNIKITKILNN